MGKFSLECRLNQGNLPLDSLLASERKLGVGIWTNDDTAGKLHTTSIAYQEVWRLALNNLYWRRQNEKIWNLGNLRDCGDLSGRLHAKYAKWTGAGIRK